MTYYLGGKKKIGKDISIMIKNVSDILDKNDEIKGDCEPFCGMMGVFQYIPETFSEKKKMKYIAGDRNPYIIKLWKGLQNGFRPPIKCTKKEYEEMKLKDDKSLKSIFVGFACAIRGVFRSTFIRTDIKVQSEYCKDIGKKIKDVHLSEGDYSQFSKLKNFIIYCDPPYKNSISPYAIGNKYNSKFDYEKFLDWCNKMSENNIVFITEYTKPDKSCVKLYTKGKEKLYVFN